MLKSKKRSTSFRGVLYIYGSLIFSLIFGLISSSMTARILPLRELGQYRFVISCVSVLVSAFSLGLFSSAGALLAGAGGGTSRRLVARGASTQVWVVAVATSICVGVIQVANHSSGTWERWLIAIVLAGVMAWPLLLQEVLRARGSFAGLGLLNMAPSGVFIILLGMVSLFKITIDASSCIILFFLSQATVVFALVISSGLILRPNLLGYAYLVKRNSTLGLNVYWGTFLAAITAQSGIFILQAFRAPEDVAVFSLALTLTAPLALLPSAVGTAYFSQLPEMPGFPKKVIGFAWATSIAIAFIFCIIVPFAIQFLYGAKFSSVIVPAQVCGVGAILQGMGDVYNRYYLANRDTAFLLRIAFVVCASAVLLGIPAGLLVGVMGVAFAKVAGSAVYALSLVYYYHFAQRRFGKLMVA